MTDAQYWSIANSLPKRTLNGIIIVDWRSAIPGCDPNIREACEFVLGFNPLSSCWVDPGAQYATRPNPYPSPSSWGVTVCNPPTTSGGGGSGTTPPGVPPQNTPQPCPNVFYVGTEVGINPTSGSFCVQPSNLSNCTKTQVLVSGKTYTKADCTVQNTQQSSSGFPAIDKNMVFIGLGVLALLMFMRK